ncbi:B12-binding domain-containing radical SAM protein [Candidatus Woesearchaeota archaeon]|nr:B12-binding domain-containing radical SAM protein [Candidatus Woesearchaeota archaeon]
MGARVLITDLPWRGKKYAGRAGMRWAHTSNKEPVISYRPFPFYIGCSAAVLEQAGHEVEVVDALSERLSEHEFFNRVSGFNPDYIVAETHTPSYNNDRYFAAELKKKTGAKIALAGPHATALPQEVLKENPAVDYVLAGEYEFLLKRLVEKKPPRGILRLKQVVDINRIPWPARHLFKMHLYNEVFCRNYPNVHLMASRGCFYRCSYCNLNTMNCGRIHRPRKAQDIVTEIKHCIDAYKPKELYFDDDIINGTPRALEAWLDLKMKEGIDMPITGMGHVAISEKLLEKMAKAGCQGLKRGVESADNRVLRRLGKGITIEMAERTLQKCKELGIRTHLTYAIGLPGDTEQTIKKTIEFAQKHGDQYQISLAAPFPGTPLYEEAKRQGWLHIESWDDLDGMKGAVISYPNLSRERLFELYQKGQKSTYTKFLTGGEWRKYIKMIYQEHGVKGVFKLIFIRGPGMIRESLNSRL